MATSSPVSPGAFSRSLPDRSWPGFDVSCVYVPAYRSFAWPRTWGKAEAKKETGYGSVGVGRHHSHSWSVKSSSPSSPSLPTFALLDGAAEPATSPSNASSAEEATRKLFNEEEDAASPPSTSPIPVAENLSHATLENVSEEAAAVETSEAAPETEDSSEEASEVVPETDNSKFVLAVGVKVIPHPAKVEKGGEDAYYFRTNKSPSVLCVADGVGGWAEDGVDPALYSREFVEHIGEAVEQGQKDPLQVLEVAHQETKAVGATTCVLATVDGQGLLNVANVGDSGLKVVRQGNVVFSTPSHQHYFDCPFQFGSESPDTVADAQVFQVTLRAGDTLVLGSDGLFDNVFEQDLAALAAVFGGPTHEAAQNTASALAALAVKHSQDVNYASPYCLEAIQQGYDVPWWQKVVGKTLTGGKVDDITVMVAQVLESSHASTEFSPVVQSEVREDGASIQVEGTTTETTLEPFVALE